MAKKNHLAGPPPLSTYGHDYYRDLWCTRSGTTIPLFHKKVLTFRLRGCRASCGGRRRSADLRLIMGSIQIFANLHYIELSICFIITIIGILVVVVRSVFKIRLFTVQTSMITNFSKCLFIYYISSCDSHKSELCPH